MDVFVYASILYRNSMNFSVLKSYFNIQIFLLGVCTFK